MGDYKKMYSVMVDASERAIEAIERQNYGLAKKLLIDAELAAEELYVETTGDDAADGE